MLFFPQMDTRRKPFDDADLLTKFERETICEPYKSFYAAKKNNFFASVEGFEDLWDCFMLSNVIWVREFEDMNAVIDPGRMFPLTLFMNGHAKMLIAMELGLSSCLTEAHSILRDAIESVVHGHRLFSDVSLQNVWLQKNDGGTSVEDFKREFWYAKEEKLFDGLPELLRLWKRFSEIGAHTNIDSIVSRFVVEESQAHVTWKLNYTGVELRTLVPALFEMLLAFHIMEEVFYKDCEDRLKLDARLVDLRTKFQHDKEVLRRKVIASFKIPRPPSRAAGFSGN